MQDLKENNKKKQVGSELNIFLTTEMEILNLSSDKKIKFNPRPFSKKKQNKNKKNFIDFHLDIVKKVDALIAEREKEEKTEEESPESQEQPETSLEDFVEIRRHIKRRPEIPFFKTDLASNSFFDDLDFIDEPSKIESIDKVESEFKFVNTLEEPKDIVFIKNLDDEPKSDVELQTKMLNIKDKNEQKSAKIFPNLKIKTKNTKSKQKSSKSKSEKKPHLSVKEKTKVKNKGPTKNHNEIEKTKEKIEERKKELIE